MATGDNTLTAMSVARQCNIIKENQNVYFGDIENDRIVWKNSKLLLQDWDTDAIASSDQSGGRSDAKEGAVIVGEETTQVPWETINEDCGAAINGKMLGFLCKNRDQYQVVLSKILFKA